MTPLFFFFYRWLFFPLLFGAFHLLSFWNPKVREGLAMRSKNQQGLDPWLVDPPSTGAVWIHCASMEFEYAKPVITELKSRDPKTKICVSYFSPSARKAIESHPLIDFSFPLPWDRATDLQKLIAHRKPKCLLIARTDTWPELLRQTAIAKIPSLLFSATLAEKSGRVRGLGRWASRSTFSYLSAVQCVSENDFRAFASLGLGARTKVVGDTRYDQVQARLKEPKPVREELFNSLIDRPIFMAGSTWSEDEVVLKEVALRFRGLVRFVFVPHEPTEAHVSNLESELGLSGLKSARYSKISSWSEDEVLIVDQVGLLAELYMKADFAFVGGSFRKTVHSVMEPLAAGCITFVGPLHANNREALELKRVALNSASNDLHCVEAVVSIMDFANRLELARRHLALHRSPGDQALTIKEEIRQQILKRSGKSSFVVDWVENVT